MNADTIVPLACANDDGEHKHPLKRVGARNPLQSPVLSVQKAIAGRRRVSEVSE